ncbi:MAG: GNAT family N-acetyltransferase [Gemmatimonadota bacterium]|nr:GNAT family N-acetyltransferase [Gemmatimonadota bacterium]
MSLRVYPDYPFSLLELASQLDVFPEGQRVAVEESTGAIAGMAASLIVDWDDYAIDDSWRDFTDHGYFTNHDPSGRTLYGAEVMVHPEHRRRGVGSALYAAREALVARLGLARIRAGARLSGYGRWAARMDAREYVERVVAGELADPTLSFQLSEGVRVIGVVEGYLTMDEASLGHAVVIEWVRPAD